MFPTTKDEKRKRKINSPKTTDRQRKRESESERGAASKLIPFPFPFPHLLRHLYFLGPSFSVTVPEEPPRHSLTTICSGCLIG
jgi:hypothetical protein